jgi:hypothetical protein
MDPLMAHGVITVAVIETKSAPFSAAVDLKVLLQEAQGSTDWGHAQ